MRLAIYLLRWQLSSPVLWAVVWWLGASFGAAVVANLIGGLVFYRVDSWIMRRGR